ncbi:MAG: nicotinate-nucleotide adenylyltransferase [Ignavibacteriales bacterium]|nr:nicotinate-nucleotide adenylyltransferase [Ignavibacteriales bacterium]
MKHSSNTRSPRRIGIFGGTFDPPHIGHLLIAENAREQFKLDRVFFVPAFIPPHKVSRRASPAALRRAMVKLAIAGNARFSLSDIEIQRQGISYTVDTLKQFQSNYPAAELVLILGGDSLKELSTWKEPEAIGNMAIMAVYSRGPSTRRKARRTKKFRVIPIAGPVIDLSSTQIRRRRKRGFSIRYLVVPAVERFIIRHHLYR